METALFKTLVDKNLVQTGTTLLVKRLAVGLSGQHDTPVEEEFQVVDFINKGADSIQVKAFRTTDGHGYRIKPHSILEIDGMDPVVLGKIYRIKPDGTLKAAGNKRGRKPKQRSTA